MPVQRSRIGRSSSFGETGLLNQVSPHVDSPDIRRNIHTSPPRIMTLSSPVQETEKENRDVSTEGFLEKCYFCKKKISENDEVFMYSYLRAFCSSECRDKQITMDKEVKKVSGESAGIMTGRLRINNVKDLFGSQLEKRTAPSSNIK